MIGITTDWNLKVFISLKWVRSGIILSELQLISVQIRSDNGRNVAIRVWLRLITGWEGITILRKLFILYINIDFVIVERPLIVIFTGVHYTFKTYVFFGVGCSKLWTVYFYLQHSWKHVKHLIVSVLDILRRCPLVSSSCTSARVSRFKTFRCRAFIFFHHSLYFILIDMKAYAGRSIAFCTVS